MNSKEIDAKIEALDKLKVWTPNIKRYPAIWGRLFIGNSPVIRIKKMIDVTLTSLDGSVETLEFSIKNIERLQEVYEAINFEFNGEVNTLSLSEIVRCFRYTTHHKTIGGNWFFDTIERCFIEEWNYNSIHVVELFHLMGFEYTQDSEYLGIITDRNLDRNVSRIKHFI